MFIQNAAPVLKNLPSLSAVSAVTGFSSRDAFDPGARHVQRGRDRVMCQLERNKKFLPQDFAGMNRRKFLCHDDRADARDRHQSFAAFVLTGQCFDLAG